MFVVVIVGNVALRAEFKDGLWVGRCSDFVLYKVQPFQWTSEQLAEVTSSMLNDEVSSPVAMDAVSDWDFQPFP